MKALKLSGGNISCFTATPKGIIDLTKPSPKSYKNALWRDLQGKKIHNKSVILTKYGDIHPFADGPVFACNNLVLDECDKNFLAYWLNKTTFPNAKNIYIKSHPCDRYVLNHEFEKVYLHEQYKRYKDRWWPLLDNISVINDGDYEQFLEDHEFDSEEFLYSSRL